MKNIDEIVVNVKANLTVDRETAETCLKMVELYVNSHNAMLLGNVRDDVTEEFYFKEGESDE